MWPCYGEHITVCMAHLVFVLCQPTSAFMHIEPYPYGLDFFLEIVSHCDQLLAVTAALTVL